MSSLVSEAVAKAHMLVFSPVTESSFSQQRLPESKVRCVEMHFECIEENLSKQVNVTCKFSGVFPLPSVKLTWGSFDLFADKMTAHINPSSSCYEVTIHKVGTFLHFLSKLSSTHNIEAT